MRVLGLIPARGGSKRLPRKNLLDLAGKSLIERAIDCARASKLIDQIWVSTEDMEISQAAQDFGAQVLHRPHSLAADDTAMVEVVRHALQNLPTDYLCLLQPTSPLRTPDDVDNCISMAFNTGSCISTHSYLVNGAVYVIKDHWPDEWKVFYEMPFERSIDIDTEMDFRIAERLLGN